jgi:hypothetical protein
MSFCLLCWKLFERQLTPKPAFQGVGDDLAILTGVILARSTVTSRFKRPGSAAIGSR